MNAAAVRVHGLLKKKVSAMGEPAAVTRGCMGNRLADFDPPSFSVFRA
jgi:hypothetical protein